MFYATRIEFHCHHDCTLFTNKEEAKAIRMKVMVWGHLEIKVALCTYPWEPPSPTMKVRVWGFGVKVLEIQSEGLGIRLKVWLQWWTWLTLGEGLVAVVKTWVQLGEGLATVVKVGTRLTLNEGLVMMGPWYKVEVTLGEGFKLVTMVKSWVQGWRFGYDSIDTRLTLGEGLVTMVKS